VVVGDNPSAAIQETGIKAVPVQPEHCEQMSPQWMINFPPVWARSSSIQELQTTSMVHPGKIAHKSSPALRAMIPSQGQRVARFHGLKVSSQAKDNLE
jgi:hypothetical protein